MNLKHFKIEYKSFCKMFYYFTASMQVINQLQGNISIFDILNHYKIKTLTDKDLCKIKDINLYDFKVFKGLNTDLVFISFKMKNIDLNRVQTVFNPADRTYRKYKYEFSKSERRILSKIKNREVYEYNHRDCISKTMQLNLNGETVYSPFEQTYENPIQTFESEYQFKSRKKREKWAEIKRRQSLRADAMKALRLWVKLKMPRLPRYKKEKKEKFNPETLKKEKGWRRGQKRDLLGLLYVDEFGQLDKELTVAPIRVKQKIIEKKSVFISTEKIEEKEKRTLW